MIRAAAPPAEKPSQVEGFFIQKMDAALEYAAKGWSQKRGCGFKAHQLRHHRGVAFISRDALRGQLKPLGARR
jgi:hypothetical protein